MLGWRLARCAQRQCAALTLMTGLLMTGAHPLLIKLLHAEAAAKSTSINGTRGDKIGSNLRLRRRGRARPWRREPALLCHRVTEDDYLPRAIPWHRVRTAHRDVGVAVQFAAVFPTALSVSPHQVQEVELENAALLPHNLRALCAGLRAHKQHDRVDHATHGPCIISGTILFSAALAHPQSAVGYAAACAFPSSGSHEHEDPHNGGCILCTLTEPPPPTAAG
jgi:hypothetical protein